MRMECRFPISSIAKPRSIGMSKLFCASAYQKSVCLGCVQGLWSPIRRWSKRFGAAIATPLLQDDRLKDLSDNHIRPFYQGQAKLAVQLLKQELGDLPSPYNNAMKIHKPEGAIFLWVWFKDLPITTVELYERLKAKGTLIIPSEHFFVGVDTENFKHAHECIRLSIAQDDDTLKKGIATIGEVVREVYKVQNRFN